MEERDVKVVFVSERGQVKGVVREVDIVRKVVAKKLNPAKVLAREIMLSPPPQVRQGATLGEVAELVAKTGVTNILIGEKNRFAGALTAGDLMTVISCFKQGTPRICRALASNLRMEMLNLLAAKPMTVDELAVALGLKPITIRHHLETLMRSGMVEEFEAVRGRPGRPSIRFRLAPTVLERR